ncbi:MAG TPA: SPOR domain-containing protein [Methylotenera sp.]|nr:SPOR domain-containing protein [Methylotenera sp.]
MPPDLPNELELALKKRARRRLVGAVALVLMMIIVLPMILKDRAALVEQESIKITMPESNLNQQDEKSVVPVPDLPPVEAAQTAIIEPDIQSAEDEPINSESIDKTTEKNKVAIKQEASLKAKAEEKAAQLKAAKPTTTEVKTPSSFIVQIGVYSELANVKQLQEKSKQAGYKSNIETIKTPKGEKYRLRTSSFVSRQSAADALAKLQAAGLPGMVMSND